MPKSHTIDEIKEKWETIKDKGSEFAHQVKEKSSDMAHSLETNPTTKDFWRYAKENKKEAVLGAFMVLGLVFSFYWLGSVVVGLAAGLYAPWGLKGLWRKAQEFTREEGQFPAFVVVVAAVFMLFHVFAFVIGLIVGLGIKSILNNEFSSDVSNQTKR
jgi:hypothetical protein